MSGNNKKNKKKFYYKQAMLNQRFNHNLKGFLICCNRGREKNAINDAYNFLNEV